MANKWPEKRRLIGTKVSRLDGPAKATGTAKYSFDVNRKGMLQATILRCPHAHAKIKSMDTSAAEKTPGFKGLFKIKDVGGELAYAGDEVLAIAADTEEHAADCIRAVKIEYEMLDHVVREQDALESSDKSRVRAPAGRTAGNIEEAFGAADAVVENTYGVPVQTHVCLESHGLVSELEGDQLTVWCSTQAVDGIAKEAAGVLRTRVPTIKSRCITHYMGGGYGSKFNLGAAGRACIELAYLTKAPVKLFLDRADEHVAVGCRPSAAAKIKIAGTKDGKITAFQADGWVSDDPVPLPYVYAVANQKVAQKITVMNVGRRQAMRAPGHPQGCFLTEAAVDDLANKLGLNPMEVRLKNLPTDKFPDGTVKADVYRKEIEIVRGLCEWDKNWHPPGKGPNKGPVKHGMGMAMHTWGGAAGMPNEVAVTISSDGSVLVRSSTQDLGTGERTVLPIVVAEVLGLEVKDISVEIGESPFGASSGSGGSTTCPGTAPIAYNAALAARDDLWKLIAERVKAKPEDLTIDPAKPGKVVDKANDKEWPWKQACAMLGMNTAKGQSKSPPPAAGLSSQGVGGVQVAEVWVDTETGVVRCRKFWAVQDCGLVINKLGCESQVAGGVIMGVHYALFEDRIMDRHTGRMVNPDMEFYKLGGIQDMPEIVVHMHDMPERGVIGIGEPPTISTAAAVGNAICNAIGARVPFSPFSPDKVLAALSQKGGKA